nr:precorrin-6Y C5,15-methyltransferase (decarboxylating) subunit CbiT [uncultured Mediterraneibacter sp.]
MCKTRQKIALVGIGMGSRQSMTAEAAEEIRSCDCMIGAGRMLDAAAEVRYDREPVPEFCEYNTEKIYYYIKEHPDYQHVVVLLSGDTGFHSGAKKLSEKLKGESDRYEIRLIPGISSVVCLAARLGTTWEDGALVSLHGQEENFIQTVNRNEKTFLLLGGKDAGIRMLEQLRHYDMEHVTVKIGSRLSYPEEKILSGHPGELSPEDVAGLCAALIINPSPERWCGPHIEDEEFIRGNVPMTKEEVRAVSVAHLKLTEDAVVYDVGAGTGSVAVEAARSGDRVRVYAIEKKTQAADLIEENRKKFRADGIRIVRGEAPEALKDLEPPTHAFIGGSSGNLREILNLLYQKNPSVRIVINAISLETVGEVMDAVENGLLKDARITQITAARSRVLGRYHMMTGLNPVYIISAGGYTGPESGKETG